METGAACATPVPWFKLEASTNDAANDSNTDMNPLRMGDSATEAACVTPRVWLKLDTKVAEALCVTPARY
jgi:hypothetical protein